MSALQFAHCLTQLAGAVRRRVSLFGSIRSVQHAAKRQMIIPHTSAMTLSTPPAGFRERTETSAYISLTGPVHEKFENGKLTALAMLIQEKHRNLRGVTHGGALMTLADTLLGDLIADCYEAPTGLVTVSLTSEFLQPAKPGDWVIGSGNVTRAGRRLAFAHCVLQVDNKEIFRATGIFAIIKPEGRR